jgi:hypothetical protein
MRYVYRKYLPLVIFLVLIGIVLIIPFKIAFNFRSTALIHPIRQWTLRTDLDGNFYGELKNFSSGAIQLSTSYRFERGDIATLVLSEGLANNIIMHHGDTLGYLYSRLVDERIQKLENLLAIENKQLKSSTTGEKTEIVDNLKQKLTLAEQQFDLSRRNFERAKILYQDSVITTNDFEIAENDYMSSITNIEIAKSEYEIAITGQKPEDIKLIEEKIASYKNEIEFLNETKKSYYLISPVSGRMVFNHYLPNQTEYISITDTSAFILYIPVKFTYKAYLSNNMKVHFFIPGASEQLVAEIFDVSDRVEFIKSNQVVFVKALIKTTSPLIVPGLNVECVFMGDEITLREYIKRTLDIFFK